MKRLLLLAFATGTLTSLPAAPLPQPDFPAAHHEVVANLAAFIRVDTVNPPGNETRGAQFMGDMLAREGIPYEIVEYAPGRGNLIARLQGGTDEAPLCLLSHIDVVGANAADWPADKQPLSGARKMA